MVLEWSAPSWLWLLLAGPLALLLALLARRETRHVVASMQPWTAVLALPRPRPRRNPIDLELIAAVLLPVAAALALAGPRLTRPDAGPERIIIVLDDSPSMTSRDPEGQSRLDAARAWVDRLAARWPRTRAVLVRTSAAASREATANLDPNLDRNAPLVPSLQTAVPLADLPWPAPPAPPPPGRPRDPKAPALWPPPAQSPSQQRVALAAALQGAEATDTPVLWLGDRDPPLRAPRLRAIRVGAPSRNVALTRVTQAPTGLFVGIHAYGAPVADDSNEAGAPADEVGLAYAGVELRRVRLRPGRSVGLLLSSEELRAAVERSAMADEAPTGAPPLQLLVADDLAADNLAWPPGDPHAPGAVRVARVDWHGDPETGRRLRLALRVAGGWTPWQGAEQSGGGTAPARLWVTDRPPSREALNDSPGSAEPTASPGDGKGDPQGATLLLITPDRPGAGLLSVGRPVAIQAPRLVGAGSWPSAMLQRFAPERVPEVVLPGGAETVVAAARRDPSAGSGAGEAPLLARWRWAGREVWWLGAIPEAWTEGPGFPLWIAAMSEAAAPRAGHVLGVAESDNRLSGPATRVFLEPSAARPERQARGAEPGGEGDEDPEGREHEDGREGERAWVRSAGGAEGGGLGARGAGALPLRTPLLSLAIVCGLYVAWREGTRARSLTRRHAHARPDGGNP